MDTEPGRDWSAVYDALSHPARREVVRVLTREAIGPVPTDDLAGRLADAGADDTDESLVRLRHLHLPKLVGAGLIDWRRADDVVVSTPFAREVPAALSEPATAIGAALEFAKRADD